jgi:hypothetical protein
MEPHVTDIGGDFLVLRGYLAGNLPEEQLRAIEARLERDPRLVRELELHLRMREGLELVQAERRRSAAPARPHRLRTWGAGLAAAAGCAGIALLLWAQRAPDLSPLRGGLASDSVVAAASPVVAQFTFVTLRSAATPDLVLPSAGVVELRATAGPADRLARFRVRLARQDAQGHAHTIGDLPGVGVAADGYLHSYVDAARLAPGAYLLDVLPEAEAAGAGATFAFRLRAPGH